MKRPLIALSALLLIASTTAHGQTITPYAGQQHRAIKALSDAEIDDLLQARGMGLAKAAELNSYPGPMHVLQLAKELELTDTQRAATKALMVKMRDAAQPLGRQIIEAERNLDQAFVNRKINTANLKKRVGAIAALQGELRNVHLRSHLAQRAILTPQQIARYDVLRGYGGDRPPQHMQRHGGSELPVQRNSTFIGRSVTRSKPILSAARW